CTRLFCRTISNESEPVPEPISSNCPSSSMPANSMSRAAMRRLQRPMNCSYAFALANIFVLIGRRTGRHAGAGSLMRTGRGKKSANLAESVRRHAAVYRFVVTGLDDVGLVPDAADQKNDELAFDLGGHPGTDYFCHEKCSFCLPPLRALSTSSA